MESFVGASVGTAVTKIVLVGFKFGMSVITARALGPEQRGVFYANLQAAGVSSSIGAGSSGEGLIFGVSGGNLPVERLLASIAVLVVTLSVAIGIVATAIFIALQGIFGTGISGIDAMAWLTLVPLMVGDYLLNSALKALSLFKKVNIINVITKGGTAILFALLYIAGTKETASFIYVYAIALLIGNAALCVAILKSSEQEARTKLPELVGVIRYGGSVHLGTLLNEVEYRGDVFILLALLSPEAVGIYSIGVTFAQVIWYVSNSVNTVLFPHLMGLSHHERAAMTQSVVKHTLITNACILGGLGLVGYPLITVLYGSEYSGSYYVFLVLAPGLLMDVISRCLSTWLKSHNRPLRVSRIAACSMLVNLMANIALIPLVGVYGAACASVISYASRAALLTAEFTRETRSSTKDMIILTRNERHALQQRLRELWFRCGKAVGKVRCSS